MRQTIVGLLLLLATGCWHTEYETKTEPATVESLIFTPATHGTGIGITGGGNIAVTSVTTNEVHGVVFHCQHGNFFVRSKELFLRFRVGAPVTIEYREEYRVNGKERVLMDYDFLDAKAAG